MRDILNRNINLLEEFKIRRNLIFKLKNKKNIKTKWRKSFRYKKIFIKKKIKLQNLKKEWNRIINTKNIYLYI